MERIHGQIKLKNIPAIRIKTPAEKLGEDDLEIGQIWIKENCSRGKYAKYHLVFRLTPCTAHTLQFSRETGELLGIGCPRRFVFNYGMEMIGTVKNMPELFEFDIQWRGTP